MRKAWGLAAVAAAATFAAGWSTAAVKQYQFTGEVVEFDAKGKTLSIRKDDETWEFSTEGLKGLKAKKGDRLTVYYSMVARRVEAK